MKPWYCDECAKEKGVEAAVVDNPHSRWVISEDAVLASGTKRAYRVRKANLCGPHMRERLEAQRPSQVPGQETFFS